MAKFQAPKFKNSEPEKLQFHTPSHSIPPLNSLLPVVTAIQRRFWLRFRWRSAISSHCNLTSLRFRAAMWASKHPELSRHSTLCCEVGVLLALQNLVNLFLIKLVRIPGFSSLFSAIAVFLHSLARCAENTAIARKREENPEILTNLMRKGLTQKELKSPQSDAKVTRADRPQSDLKFDSKSDSGPQF